MKLWAVGAYGALALCAFSLGLGWTPQRTRIWLKQRAASAAFEQRYEPEVDPFWNGPELVMVYVGQKHCAPSNARELPQQIEDLKADLARLANKAGARFRALGVSLDVRARDGIEHLGKFGDFDEIHVGGGLFSDAAMRFLWQTYPGVVATPQVVVLRRQRFSQRSLTAPVSYGHSRGEELGRLMGLDGIAGWRRDSPDAIRLRSRIAGGDTSFVTPSVFRAPAHPLRGAELPAEGSDVVHADGLRGGPIGGLAARQPFGWGEEVRRPRRASPSSRP